MDIQVAERRRLGASPPAHEPSTVRLTSGVTISLGLGDKHVIGLQSPTLGPWPAVPYLGL